MTRQGHLVVRDGLVSAGLRAVAALALLGCYVCILAQGSMERDPMVAVAGLGVLAGVGYLIAGAVCSTWQWTRRPRRVRVAHLGPAELSRQIDSATYRLLSTIADA